MPLFTYRSTPQTTTGISTAELLMNWKLNSKINSIKPGAELSENVFLPNVTRLFKEGDKVWIQNFSVGNKWTPGTILCCTGPESYKALTKNRKVKKHLDYLRKKESPIRDEIYPEGVARKTGLTSKWNYR